MRLKYTTPIKLDIGCGLSKKEGYTGIDILDRGQEIVWDVRSGIPVPDNSVEAIHTSHFVEHLEDRDLGIFFSELLRICKDDTNITISCPEASSLEAHFNCHLSMWSEDKIKGICQGIESSPESKGHFQIVSFNKQGMEMRCVLKVKK